MSPSICLLCGGVGGARAALALAENLPHERLTFVVNTGDDFHHLGLEVWPDWDTLLYTLSQTGDAVRGWGREDEGVRAMEEFRRLGAPDWFHLGDRDLALHVVRTWQLTHLPADEVARRTSEKFGLTVPMLRATEQSLATRIRLSDGTAMDFQTWFVGYQGQPEVANIEVPQADTISVTPGVLSAIRDCDLLLIAPSNPYLSIFPMLKVPAIGESARKRRQNTWAISPLIDGHAVKGPLDRLIASLSPYRGQHAVLDCYKSWAHRLLLPGEEISNLPRDILRTTPCRTRLGTREQRRDFVTDLLDAWEKSIS